MGFSVVFKGCDVEVVDVDFTPGRPAKLNGLPENCYPAEDGDLEFTIATGNELLDLLLEEDYQDEIAELVAEQAEKEMLEDYEDAKVERQLSNLEY